MKIILLIASVILLGGAGIATAADESATTRARVVAELARARAAGELDFNDASYPLTTRERPSGATRALIRAELLRARAAGEMEFTDGSYPVSVTVAPSGLTRQAVLAEVARARARAAGELENSDAARGAAMAMQATHAR